MAEYSKVTITFNVDLEEVAELKLSSSYNEVLNNETWVWVATRSAAYEVTEGTPTGTAGETTAINYAAAFLLDNPTDFVVNQTANEVEIISETEGLDFVGLKIDDALGVPLVNGVGFNVVFDNYTIPIDYSNIDFALVRSPHYVYVPFNFETTVSVTINLYVWDGNLSTVPTTPTQTLTIPRPSIDFSEFNIDLSKLISEALKPKPEIILTSATQVIDSTDDSVKWVKYTATYNDSTETIPDIEGTFVAVEGHGYYSEGVNPTKPTDNILTECVDRKVSRDGFILFPFINNGEISFIDINSTTDEIGVRETITPSGESSDIIQYIGVDVSNATTDSDVTITIQPTGDTITYEIIDECRYNPIQVVFKNRYGVFDSVSLFKKSKPTLKTKSDEFVNNYVSGGTYNTTKHQYQKLNVTGKKSIKANSGYIGELENALYEQLLLSDLVYFYEDDALVPVNVATSSLEYKTRVNDSLVNYTIDFDYAYNTIQNI